MLGTLGQLAESIGGTVVGDASTPIARVDAIDEAGPSSLTFAAERRYVDEALNGNAAAVLIDASIVPATASKPMIVVPNARRALAQLLASMRTPRPRGPFVHPNAVVEHDAELCADVFIGANAYVGKAARIGARSIVDAGAYVGDGVVVGADAWLHPHSKIMERCRVGDRVVLHAGCVIGSEGFGWAFEQGRMERIPQVGNVVLDEDVEIGANTCVDRAQTGSTHIGAGTKIDNLVQIGHNCRIGKHCVFAALSGLAGTTVIGDYVKVAGQSGFRGHLKVGNRVTVAGHSGVWGDVPDGATVSGNPARNHRDELRREVMIRKLPELIARIEALERGRLAEREEPTDA